MASTKKGPEGRKKGHSNRHITCGKVCGRNPHKVAIGRVYVPALPPGIRGGWYGGIPPAEFVRQNPSQRVA